MINSVLARTGAQQFALQGKKKEGLLAYYFFHSGVEKLLQLGDVEVWGLGCKLSGEAELRAAAAAGAAAAAPAAAAV